MPAALRRLRRERGKCGEIADAAIAVATQTVDLRRDAPERRGVGIGVVFAQGAPCIVDGEAARGRNRERRAMVVDDERVIARLRDRREQRDLAFRRREAPVDHFAAFEFDAIACALLGRRHRQRNAAIHFRGDERRQLAAAHFGIDGGHALPDLRGVGARQAKLVEQNAQRRFRHALHDLVRVLPFDLEARARRERLDAADGRAA